MYILLDFCALIFGLLGIIIGTDSATLRFYHGSLYNYTETSVEEPLRLLPYFNRDYLSMFYVFGFNETADSEDPTLMVSTYLSTRYTNVLILDWSNEARAPSNNVMLSYAVVALHNTEIVGRAFGRALVTYITNGIYGDKMHVVGHSLGSHVAGYAGTTVKEYNFELARITGLDPAGPLFDGSYGLNPSTAKFVDVLHTDPNKYGINRSIGSVDFWANCGDAVQPGCPRNSRNMGVVDGLCSHWRSFKIFSEAIISPTSVVAVKADTCTSWYSQRTSSQIIYLGDLGDTGARGHFYFSTRSEAPFSKGRAGLVPNN